MKNFKEFIKSLNNLIEKHGDINRAKGIEKYFKYLIKSKGLTSHKINSVYKEFKKEYQNELKELSLNDKFEFSNLMLKSTYFEEKIMGIIMMSEIAKKLEINEIIKIKETFEEGHINNWGTCDAICGKVLKPWTTLRKENTLEISRWSENQNNIWIRRASCVTFITRVKLKDENNFDGFTDLMFEICQNNIIFKDRFNQLATGWLLRELSVVQKPKFLIFFYSNFNHFIREGIRYAIEKLPEIERKKLLNYRPDDELNNKRKKK